MQEQKPPLMPQEEPVGRGKLLFMLMAVTVVLLLFIVFSGRTSSSSTSLSPPTPIPGTESQCELASSREPLENRIRQLEARLATFETEGGPATVKQQSEVAAAPLAVARPKEDELFFVALQEELQGLAKVKDQVMAQVPPALSAAPQPMPQALPTTAPPQKKPTSAKTASQPKNPSTPTSSSIVASAETTKNTPPTPRIQTHIVKRGETLSQISLEYYGTAQRWKLIYEANRAQIPNINQLKVGTELIIPELSKK